MDTATKQTHGSKVPWGYSGEEARLYCVLCEYLKNFISEARRTDGMPYLN